MDQKQEAKQVDGATRRSELAFAKQQVMDEVSYVQKSSANGLNYTFASESDVINALRPAMIKHGLVFRPVSVHVIADEQVPTNSGKFQRRLTIIRQFELKHVDSGEMEWISVLGEAADSGDKAAPKAMTIAKKYALREAFLLETGDDPDYYRAEADPETRVRLLRFHTAIKEAKKLDVLNTKFALVEKAATENQIDADQLNELRAAYLMRRGELS